MCLPCPMYLVYRSWSVSICQYHVYMTPTALLDVGTRDRVTRVSRERGRDRRESRAATDSRLT